MRRRGEGSSVFKLDKEANFKKIEICRKYDTLII